MRSASLPLGIPVPHKMGISIKVKEGSEESAQPLQFREFPQPLPTGIEASEMSARNEIRFDG